MTRIPLSRSYIIIIGWHVGNLPLIDMSLKNQEICGVQVNRLVELGEFCCCCCWYHTYTFETAAAVFHPSHYFGDPTVATSLQSNIYSPMGGR